MSRVLAAVGATVVAVALAGCATTATGGAGSKSAGSTSVVAEPTVATTSAATASSITAPSITASSGVPTAADGWYDTWGWVSPQTAERALAAGIVAGKDVRDELRCGIGCGESPTAAEIQAQYIADHPGDPNASIDAYQAAAAACPGYFIRGNCYADADAARAAAEGE